MLPIRILLVDDSAVFLNSVESFLSTDPAVKIVGRALSGRSALEQISSLQPDLVLMDLSMPEMSGLEATRLIKARKDAPCVVILTLHNHPQYRKASQAAGADGFVSKAELGTQLIPQIHILLGGNTTDAEKEGVKE
ncbi:MAG: response regulator transcription factor [Chloroflexi bacterium]|nr:response regulator transcription factor [Chloroflexota bacterium]